MGCEGIFVGMGCVVSVVLVGAAGVSIGSCVKGGIGRGSTAGCVGGCVVSGTDG